MKEISREPDHAASGLHQEQEGLKRKTAFYSGLEQSDKTTDPLSRATGPF